MEKWMKRIVTFSLALILVGCAFSAQAVSQIKEFDLTVFRNQDNPKGTKKQYSISIDDMEARGFISMNGTLLPDDSGYTYNYINADMWLYLVEPDIYLANYGTEKFYPLPRIWFKYYGKDLYTYSTAIFKIGETTYTFDNIYVSQSTSNWSKNCRFESKSVCLCTLEYKDFMDAFIENGTKQIKVRLKGTKSTQDFMIPAEAQKSIVLMFQNFKDAGGYDLLPRGK